MTLIELVSLAAQLDRDCTIYAARPWTASSEAVAAFEPEDGSLPEEAEGMAYLLEVFLVTDVLDAWSSHRSGATPTSQQACAAVIHYADYDAYLSPGRTITGKAGAVIDTRCEPDPRARR